MPYLTSEEVFEKFNLHIVDFPTASKNIHKFIQAHLSRQGKMYLDNLTRNCCSCHPPKRALINALTKNIHTWSTEDINKLFKSIHLPSAYSSLKADTVRFLQTSSLSQIELENLFIKLKETQPSFQILTNCTTENVFPNNYFFYFRSNPVVYTFGASIDGITKDDYQLELGEFDMLFTAQFLFGGVSHIELKCRSVADKRQYQYQYTTPYQGLHHPHLMIIDYETHMHWGRLCLGQGHRAFDHACTFFDIGSAIDLILSVLNGKNPDGGHAQPISWFPQCRNCQSAFSDETKIATCCHCNSQYCLKFCGQYITMIEGENKYHCSRCFKTCHECKKNYCTYKKTATEIYYKKMSYCPDCKKKIIEEEKIATKKAEIANAEIERLKILTAKECEDYDRAQAEAK